MLAALLLQKPWPHPPYPLPHRTSGGEGGGFSCKGVSAGGKAARGHPLYLVSPRGGGGVRGGGTSLEEAAALLGLPHLAWDPPAGLAGLPRRGFRQGRHASACVAGRGTCGRVGPSRRSGGFREAWIPPGMARSCLRGRSWNLREGQVWQVRRGADSARGGTPLPARQVGEPAGGRGCRPWEACGAARTLLMSRRSPLHVR